MSYDSYYGSCKYVKQLHINKSEIIKIHFLGPSSLFVRLQIQIQRLDFIMVRPRAGALGLCVREDLAARKTLQASS